MNRIIEWLTNNSEPDAPKQTVYVWQDANSNPPTEEMLCLVVREHNGKFGTVHFDLFCPGQGWMQIAGFHVGVVVLWMKEPFVPEKNNRK